MLSAREYVEEKIVARLNKEYESDNPVDYLEYCQICSEIEHLIDVLSTETKLPGFTKEDLESIFYMKIHQSLRRGQYDHKRSPFAFFVVAFNNLTRDMYRMMERAIKRGHYLDPMDTVLPIKGQNLA